MRMPRLTQTIPPPRFEVMAGFQQEWLVAVRDAQDVESVFYTAPLGRWTMRDMAIAGARLAANGQAVVAVQRIEQGIATACGVFSVLHAWERWFVHPLN